MHWPNLDKGWHHDEYISALNPLIVDIAWHLCLLPFYHDTHFFFEVLTPKWESRWQTDVSSCLSSSHKLSSHHHAKAQTCAKVGGKSPLFQFSRWGTGNIINHPLRQTQLAEMVEISTPCLDSRWDSNIQFQEKKALQPSCHPLLCSTRMQRLWFWMVLIWNPMGTWWYSRVNQGARYIRTFHVSPSVHCHWAQQRM